MGFVFLSPGPAKEDLKSYHKEGFSGFKEIGLPYSIENRIKILKKYAFPEGIFVEVGGDAPFKFHSELDKKFLKNKLQSIFQRIFLLSTETLEIFKVTL